MTASSPYRDLDGSVAGRLAMFRFWRPLVDHWTLIKTLAWRQINARYRGSLLGLAWVLVTPLIMLAVYTYVFSIIFAKRWDVYLDGQGNFALFLFAGLCCHQMMAECLTRSPSLMHENKTYAKKIIFPLDALPWVLVLTSAFTLGVNLIILLCMYVAMIGLPPASLLLLPAVVLPLVLMSAGIAWLCAALGVYLRDLRHVTSILATLLLFLTPIFYPLQAVPEAYRMFVRLNPLAEIVEALRSLAFAGELFAPGPYALVLGSSALIAALGYALFNRVSDGFADVL